MTEQWAWRIGEGSAEGPFNSREEAIADARTHMPTATISLGHVIYVKPADYVTAVDADWILDQMDENVEINYDDAIFEIGPGGNEALTKALKVWASRYVEANMEWFMPDEEAVNLAK